MRLTVLAIFCILLTQVSAQNRFSRDAELRKIYTFQYNAQTDSLLPYFKSQNTEYAKTAILAFGNHKDTAVLDLLFQILTTNSNQELRTAAAFSIGQFRLEKNSEKLLKVFKSEKSEPVQFSILEALSKSGGKTATDFILAYKPKTTEQELVWLRALYLVSRQTEVREAVLESCLPETKKQAVWTENTYLYKKLKDKLQKGKAKSAVRNSLKLYPLSKDFIKLNPYQKTLKLDSFTIAPEELWKLAIESEQIPLKSYCISRFFEEQDSIDSRYLIHCFTQSDIAFISGAADYVFRNHKSKEDRFISLYPLMKTRQNLLSMPREFEAWHALERALQAIQDKPFSYQSPYDLGYSHEINWDLVVKIPQRQKIKIVTNKGEMILELLVNESPASAANFYQLVQDSFYNQKYFHRVVPDFVIQGGCPRGDGWGSLDWNQRSEFTMDLHYKPGSVGLASAGQDSEGVQFFITHSWPVHLNGRYTIFAEMTDGFEVLNSIKIGDQILRIEIL